MKHIAFSFSIMLFFQQCKPYNTTLIDETFHEVKNSIPIGDTSTVYRLDLLLHFDWDRLIILYPYYSKSLLKTKCGILDELPSSKIEGTEGYNEYLFIKRGRIIKHLILDDPKSKIMVTFYQYSPNLDTMPCGIANSPNTFIKQIRNENRDWDGRTFLIFTAE
ncbi:MAG: hypothetical protein WKF35_07830 [Ferruginibacter sp.]